MAKNESSKANPSGVSTPVGFEVIIEAKGDGVAFFRDLVASVGDDKKMKVKKNIVQSAMIAVKHPVEFVLLDAITKKVLASGREVKPWEYEVTTATGRRQAAEVSKHTDWSRADIAARLALKMIANDQALGIDITVKDPDWEAKHKSEPKPKAEKPKAEKEGVPNTGKAKKGGKPATTTTSIPPAPAKTANGKIAKPGEIPGVPRKGKTINVPAAGSAVDPKLLAQKKEQAKKKAGQ